MQSCPSLRALRNNGAKRSLPPGPPTTRGCTSASDNRTASPKQKTGRLHPARVPRLRLPPASLTEVDCSLPDVYIFYCGSMVSPACRCAPSRLAPSSSSDSESSASPLASVHLQSACPLCPPSGHIRGCCTALTPACRPSRHANI